MNTSNLKTQLVEFGNSFLWRPKCGALSTKMESNSYQTAEIYCRCEILFLKLTMFVSANNYFTQYILLMSFERNRLGKEMIDL